VLLRAAVHFNGLVETGEPLYIPKSSFGSQFEIYSQFHSPHFILSLLACDCFPRGSDQYLGFTQAADAIGAVNAA
jgi:hypothetical protein